MLSSTGFREQKNAYHGFFFSIQNQSIVDIVKNPPFGIMAVYCL